MAGLTITKSIIIFGILVLHCIINARILRLNDVGDTNTLPIGVIF